MIHVVNLHIKNRPVSFNIPVLRVVIHAMPLLRLSSYMHSVSLGMVLFISFFLSSTVGAGEILDDYIQQGLSSNLALKQKELDLETILQALKEANGLFYPQIGVESQYINSKGGRSVDMPTGDMLNPAYSALNQILESMGQQGQFPQIDNQEIRFLPNDYHDTKMRVILPLVNAEIYYNRKIKKEAIQYSQAEMQVYKRELVKVIKTAYIRYMQSIKVVEAYTSARDLVNELYRVNEKMVNNQMTGKEKLLRIEAEKGQVEAQLLKAANDQNTAAAYFNFLLNQPLQNPILVDSSMSKPNEQPDLFVGSFELKNREEMLQLNSALKQSDYFLKLKRSYLIPSIANITDLGYQGDHLSFGPDQQYFMNTISLQWTLFNGFQNRSRIQQAKIQNAVITNKLSETEQQIELQERLSGNSLESARGAESANLRSLNSSKEYYKVISRQYAEGQKSLLELLDARNQLTTAQIQYEISHYDVLIRQSEYERVTAAYLLPVD